MDRFQTQQHNLGSVIQAQPAWWFKKVRVMMIGALAMGVILVYPSIALAGDASQSGASSSGAGSSTSSTSSSSSSSALKAQPPVLKPTPFTLPKQAYPTIQKTLPIQNRASIQPRQ